MYSDSQTVHSKLVRECLIFLSAASKYFLIRLILFPGHSYIAENCEADDLARKGILETFSPDWEQLVMAL